ncbi:MAG: shikimate dehydrogenase [Synechococcales bacterium]|nr:shikimate dehydrogenase [Synechococcales bacterium]
MITGSTQLLGVIGHPVKHSLSPLMHNAAIAHLGADYIYLPFPVAPAELPAAIAGFAAIGLRGFNITLPHKQAIIPLLDQVADVAQAIGAVNTVLRTDAGWQGTNTDGAGFIAPLKSLRSTWSDVTAVVLGNGGAARAVVAGCAQLGCPAIQVVGRSPEKLSQFLQSWQTSPLTVPLSVHPWGDLPTLLPQANLVVNTTPVGMAPQVDASPLTQENWDKVCPGTIAYDLIYTPNPTRFLQQARERGAIALDGLEMLVQQGAAALELWLQQPVPVEIMRQAAREHLGLTS